MSFGAWLLVACTTAIAGPAAAQAWQRVSDDEGIRVEIRDVPGQTLPTFRSIAMVQANIYDIAAVIDDVDRACQWTARCLGARTLQRYSDTLKLFYTRTDSPWPVQDRDAVLRGRATGIAEGQDILIVFEVARSPLMPEVKDVVRMPRLVGHYRLTRQADAATRVEFQVFADPGGWIPDWLSAQVSRSVPFDTLVGLRKQVVRMRGKYPEFMEKHVPKPPPPVAAPPVSPPPPAQPAP